jgi:uncharacterized UPF0146 family protein
MVKITASIPQELYDKMKQHSDVNWDEVVVKAIANYIDRLEIAEGGAVPMKKLAKTLKDSGVDISNIDLEKAIKYYKEGSKLELTK